MVRKDQLMRHAPATGPHPTTVLLRLSVLLGATAGFTLGFALLGAIVLGRADDLPWAALVQVHGQVQVVGFVGLFVLGTAAQLLPGFLARPLTRRGLVIRGGSLIAGALLLRAVAQPLDPSLLRSVGLWLAAVAEVGGVGLCLYRYADLVRRTVQPPDLWRHLAMIGFGFLGLSVLLNLVATAFLATGRAVVPDSLDEALVHLELAGFVVFVVFGVSRKVLPRFLLLQPPRDAWLRRGAGCYLVGVILVSAGYLLGAVPTAPTLGRAFLIVGTWPQLVGVLLFLHGLNLYRPPARPSGAPNVTDPVRRWSRLAFAWLVVANGLAVVWATRAFLGGPLATFFETTAARHAFAQGFVLTIVVALGSRVLPSYSAWAIRRPRLIEALISAITLGAALRVAGELVTAWGGLAGEAVAGAGGAFAVVAFGVFAVAVFATIGRTPGTGRQTQQTRGSTGSTTAQR